MTFLTEDGKKITHVLTSTQDGVCFYVLNDLNQSRLKAILEEISEEGKKTPGEGKESDR